MPRKDSQNKKGPKTELDRKFLLTIEQAMSKLGIQSDRAMSIELARHPNFINRVRNGLQSAPPDAWETLHTKFPTATDSVTTNIMAQGGGQAIGTNKGTAIGSLTFDDCQRDLVIAQKEIAHLTSQLVEKERTIQILLKQTAS